MNRSGSRAFVASLVTIAALLATTACDSRGQPPTSTMSTTPDQQFQELMKRPDIERASQRYEEMRAAIRSRLAETIGLPPWKEDTKTASRSSCREFPEIDTADKQSRTLPIWYTEANVPDDTWPRAVQITTEIVSKYGFGSPSVVVDSPGNHEISAKDGYGAEIIFGTKADTVLTLLTGCHLTTEAHKRGKPSGRP